MVIGLCYDLKDDYLQQGFSKEEAAEFDLAETIDAVEEAIVKNGFYCQRIGNIYSLCRQLSSGKSWDLVFNIAEGVYGFGRESVVPALLEQYRIKYTFSDPLTLALSLHKGFCKRILSYHHIPNSPFLEICSKEQLDPEKIMLQYPLFAKPVAEGTSKGISAASRIDSVNQLHTVVADLLERFKQPVLLEEFLPGREITVGVVGSGKKARVIGAVEVKLKEGAEQSVYSLFNKQNYQQYVEYFPLSKDELREVSPLVLKAWQVLNCRDAGRVDLRFDRYGNCNVLEINPLAGLHPVDSDLPIICRHFAISYTSLIGEIISSALER